MIHGLECISLSSKTSLPSAVRRYCDGDDEEGFVTQIGATPEAVLTVVDALALRRVRVGVKVGDFFSAEDTLELCRQLRSREIEFIAIAPLEWSTVRTMDLLQAMAIEVVVRHSFLDSEPINLPLLERICADVDAPIWIHGCGVGFDDAVLQALHRCGCRGLVIGEPA